jgi:hypothetical protein
VELPFLLYFRLAENTRLRKSQTDTGLGTLAVTLSHEIQNKTEINMELLYGIPNTLYKYRIWEDEYNKRLITHNELYLSSANQFNDPFDATLPFRYVDKDISEENVIQKLLQVGRDVNPQLSERQLIEIAKERYQSGEFNSDEYWRKFHPEFRKQVNERYGIYCLTTKNDNLLMWSHYANSHRGFCVGFDKFKLFETAQGMIGKITYSTDFPKVPMFEEGIGGLTQLIMTKSEHWEYEDEYRITKSSASRKTLILDNSAFKEIILGCNIDPKSREEIISVVKAKSTSIKIYDSKIDDKEFKLNLVEIE